MSTIFVCDWCGDEFPERDKVGSVDLTVGATNEKLHICAECAPDPTRQHFPAE